MEYVANIALDDDLAMTWWRISSYVRNDWMIYSRPNNMYRSK